MLQAYRDHGILYQSYSSLAQGCFTGKYNADKESLKSDHSSDYPMKDFEPTVKVLKGITVVRCMSADSVTLKHNVQRRCSYR